MKNILGIIGSPRRLGNSEIMVKEIGRHFPISHELKLLRLPEFDIQPCRGCYRCLFDEKGCPQDDDFSKVLDAITAADAIVLVVPAYFLGPNACIKQFMDRGLAFYAHTEKLWGKPSVGIGIAGIEGKEGYTLLGIESFLSILLTDLKESLMVYGALPGEVFLNDKNRNTAAELAKALFSNAAEKTGPRCPLCGGATFRFLENDEIRCMLCSNSGSFGVEKGEPVFRIEQSHHEMFLSKDGVMRHGEWLRGMKNRFIEQKQALREVTGPYRKEGVWIRPAE